VVADGLLAIEPGGQIRAAERYLEHATRREQVDEAFGVLIQQHFPPSLQVTEQILARIAESLASEPVHSLALMRSMLTHPEAAQTLREGAARYQAQISAPIPADDADVRAALVGAVMLGVIVSRHLLNSDALTAASPQQVIDLLRPCLRSLTRADPAPER